MVRCDRWALNRSGASHAFRLLVAPIGRVIDQLKDLFALERHRAKTLHVFWPV